MENLTIEQLGQELSDIINQDGDEKTDGQCLDEVMELLSNYNLYTNREE